MIINIVHVSELEEKNVIITFFPFIQAIVASPINIQSLREVCINRNDTPTTNSNYNHHKWLACGAHKLQTILLNLRIDAPNK